MEKENKILYDLAKLCDLAGHGLVEFPVTLYRKEIVLQLWEAVGDGLQTPMRTRFLLKFWSKPYMTNGMCR